MLALEVGAGVVLLLLVLPLVVLAARRRLLQRSGGAIELSLRLHRGRTPGCWVLGVGRFEGDELRCYRMFSLAPGPRHTLSRRDLNVTRRRRPVGSEEQMLLGESVVMECVDAGGSVELAMDDRMVTGFLAWLESRPPGATLPAA